MIILIKILKLIVLDLRRWTILKWKKMLKMIYLILRFKSKEYNENIPKKN